MSDYRRFFLPGGSFFFTLVAHQRRPILVEPPGIECLRAAFRTVLETHPFTINAIVILPDHLHAIWTLPEGDSDYSVRWTLIKREFTRRFLVAGGAEGTRSRSRRRRRERGIWQRRFWEHMLLDESDFERHADYIHYNPVKHGLVQCPKDWLHSSFHSWVKKGYYSADWGCVRNGEMSFDDLRETALE